MARVAVLLSCPFLSSHAVFEQNKGCDKIPQKKVWAKNYILACSEKGSKVTDFVSIPLLVSAGKAGMKAMHEIVYVDVKIL